MRCPSEVSSHLDVSRETLDRLEQFIALLLRWNPKINLISPKTVADIWHRHVLDSAQVFKLAPIMDGRWVDLGAGGGFPGVVAAILAQEIGDMQFSFIEADQRKSAFLRAAIRECDLPARVVAERIETAEPEAADVLSARALAPLKVLLSYADRHLKQDGTAIFLKGARAHEEVAAARKTWSFECEAAQSITDGAASILRIGELQRV